jgi:hypothetical protein
MLRRQEALINANNGVDIRLAQNYVNETTAVHARYQQLTNGFKGKVFSLLPGTKAFKCRIECALSINSAVTQLAIAKKWQDKIGSPYLVAPRKQINEPPIRRVKSEEEVLPRHHPSPLDTPRKSQDDIDCFPSKNYTTGLTVT